MRLLLFAFTFVLIAVRQTGAKGAEQWCKRIIYAAAEVQGEVSEHGRHGKRLCISLKQGGAHLP